MFQHLRSLPLGSPGFEGVNAGTRVVPSADGTWYLFGRRDAGNSTAGAACPVTSEINVRASTDAGASWGPPRTVAAPDTVNTCIYADGTAFYDGDAATWHYLTQSLRVNGTGGWALSHFSAAGGPDPTDPGLRWRPNPANPVVTGGQLFGPICDGAGKHCSPGTTDEGTPEIVAKAGGEYYVTFHGYDYGTRRAVRGVARTPDFVSWAVTGGADPLPGDAIFSSADCDRWSVPWAPGGCVGGGEASVIRGPSGHLYQLIEAADLGLTCNSTPGAQWWPLGLVRAPGWSGSPRWEQMPRTPFVGGPGGGEPHVGCSIQYNSMHRDPVTAVVYLAFWDVSFHPRDPAAAAPQAWHLYALNWGAGAYPIQWPGPPQAPPGPGPAATGRAPPARLEALQSGDLVFVQPPRDPGSALDSAILATGAATIGWMRRHGLPVTGNQTVDHVAIALRRPNGLYFVQAVPPQVVLTPAADFLREVPPGTVLFGATVTAPGSVDTAATAAAAAAAAVRQLGKPYAEDFGPPPAEFYCSSLAQWAYGAAAAAAVFLPEGLDFTLLFEPPGFWERWYAAMNRSVPVNVTGSNPTLLLHSPATHFARLRYNRTGYE